VTDLSVSGLDTRLTNSYYTSAQTDIRYLGPLAQNYTVGSSTTSGQYKTTMHQNLTIGSFYSNVCTCMFYGKVYLRDVVNSDTTLTIGKINSAYEDASAPLNIYKYTNFNKYVYLKDWVSPATTLIIGAYNGDGETSGNSLNIYKVSNY
jgi:hypothetical protein